MSKKRTATFEQALATDRPGAWEVQADGSRKLHGTVEEVRRRQNDVGDTIYELDVRTAGDVLETVTLAAEQWEQLGVGAEDSDTADNLTDSTDPRWN